MAHSFITCTLCGKREDLEVYRLLGLPLVARMRADKVCFDCAYWQAWLSNPEPDTVIISGKLYKHTEPFQISNLLQLRTKDMHFVIDATSNKAYTCRNLILRGAIPSQFQSVLPDQYKFITRDEYRRIYQYNAEMCLSKGCFDRYHCIWYRADIAEPDEPWNTIPNNYQVGSEDCPSFVNKNGKRNS
ncbi:MAG: hypothetical protein ACOCO5_06425 [Segatella copri]